MQISFEYEFFSVQVACASWPGGPRAARPVCSSSAEQRFLAVAFDLNPKVNPYMISQLLK